MRRPATGWRLPGWVSKLKPLPVLAGLLGLVLLAELLPGGSGDAPQPSTTLPKDGGAIEGANVQGWTQTILARPLFNPDRRPSGDAADGSDGLPRLSAILIGQGMASAIFVADGQKPQVVQQGGLVGGDKVQIITADEVVLLTAAGPLALHPQFAKASAAQAAASSAAQAPTQPPSGTAPPAAPPGNPPPAPQDLSKNGQPQHSSFTAGPYDNE